MLCILCSILYSTVYCAEKKSQFKQAYVGATKSKAFENWPKMYNFIMSANNILWPALIPLPGRGTQN